MMLRFCYDSICKYDENSPKIAPSNQSDLGSVNEESHRSCIRSFLDEIYPWETKFRFITISLCAYGTAFIFLYHATCTLIFHYSLGRTSYISFFINGFQSMLNIGKVICVDLIRVDFGLFQRLMFGRCIGKWSWVGPSLQCSLVIKYWSEWRTARRTWKSRVKIVVKGIP